MPCGGHGIHDNHKRLRVGSGWAGKFKVRCKEAISCPICNGSFKAIGSKRRKLIETTGIKKVLIIRRLRCENCETIHHELPDILIPYKRHCAETIEGLIAGKTIDAVVDDNTGRKIRNWWRKLLPYFIGIINSLSIKHRITFNSCLTPREIVRAVTNANLYIHTRSEYTPG